MTSVASLVGVTLVPNTVHAGFDYSKWGASCSSTAYNTSQRTNCCALLASYCHSDASNTIDHYRCNVATPVCFNSGFFSYQ
jgi:hypothetical protein